MAKMKSNEPEYLVCIDCETPCYDFTWENGEPKEVMCMACGEDNPDIFATQEDFDAMMS